MHGARQQVGQCDQIGPRGTFWHYFYGDLRSRPVSLLYRDIVERRRGAWLFKAGPDRVLEGQTYIPDRLLRVPTEGSTLLGTSIALRFISMTTTSKIELARGVGTAHKTRPHDARHALARRPLLGRTLSHQRSVSPQRRLAMRRPHACFRPKMRRLNGRQDLLCCLDRQAIPTSTTLLTATYPRGFIPSTVFRS